MAVEVEAPATTALAEGAEQALPGAPRGRWIAAAVALAAVAAALLVVLYLARGRVAPRRTALHHRAGRRITSYNVCYTKLLRFPSLRNPRFFWAVEQVCGMRSPQILSQVLNSYLIPIPLQSANRHGLSIV